MKRANVANIKSGAFCSNSKGYLDTNNLDISLSLSLEHFSRTALVRIRLEAYIKVASGFELGGGLSWVLGFLQ